MSNQNEDVIPQVLQPLGTTMVAIYGPYNWTQLPGQLGFLNGQMHSWAIGPYPGSQFWCSMVSAHPWQQYSVQALAVEKLSTAYTKTEGPSVNFVVHNVSSGISGYRVYVGLMGLQSVAETSEKTLASPQGGVQTKVFAIHDASGIISEIVTSPKHSPQPILTTSPGLSMTEVEIPEGVDETQLNSFQGLTKLMEDYRVQVPNNKPAILQPK